VILGTAAYMAPEQARGLAVDRRADIWAFGVVLYEMLTGRTAFAAATVPDTLAAVLTREVDWTALPEATPPAIRRLLRRCLERDPRRRLRDIADARLDLDEVAAGTVEDAPAPAAALQAPRRPPVPWLLGAGALGLLVGAAIGIRFLSPQPEPAGPEAPAATIRTLVAAGESIEPALAPDGRTLAFVSWRNGEQRIWIKDLASGSESPISRKDAWHPVFSPDGTSLLFQATSGGSTELFRIALATREERLVARHARDGGWSPDGRTVLFVRSRLEGSTHLNDLLTVAAGGGEERVLRRATAAQWINEPVWSPDGGRVAWTETGATAGIGDRIAVFDIEGRELESFPVEIAGLPGLTPRVQGKRWLSDRRLALLLSDGSDQAMVGSAGRVATLDLGSGRVRSVLPLSTVGFGLDVAGPGALVVSLGSRTLNLFESALAGGGRGGGPVPVTEGPFTDRQPVYSPDGQWLAFSSTRSGNFDVWKLARASGELRRLTDHEATDWDPAWSPGGERLLFSSNRSGRFQIWIADADGSSPRQVTDLENAQNPTMTPDGEWIVFVRQDAGDEANGIWKIRPDGRDLTPVAVGPYFLPEVSPDGRVVAFRGTQEQGLRLVYLADGRRLPIELPATNRFRWSDGGGLRLWALSWSERGVAVVRARFDPERGTLGPVEIVVPAELAGEAETLGVARDGSAVTFSRFAHARTEIVRIDGLRELAAER
jgi:eukaryotic-like serine/threonine-protein kinase